MTIHEDNRRKLTSLPEAKILEIKESCVIGKHYHKIKTEWFVLCKGEAVIGVRHVPDGKAVSEKMVIGDIIKVSPYMYHEFYISAGSVLFGACSHPYDQTDDYHL